MNSTAGITWGIDWYCSRQKNCCGVKRITQHPALQQENQRRFLHPVITGQYLRIRSQDNTDSDKVGGKPFDFLWQAAHRAPSDQHERGHDQEEGAGCHYGRLDFLFF